MWISHNSKTKRAYWFQTFLHLRSLMPWEGTRNIQSEWYYWLQGCAWVYPSIRSLIELHNFNNFTWGLPSSSILKMGHNFTLINNFSQQCLINCTHPSPVWNNSTSWSGTLDAHVFNSPIITVNDLNYKISPIMVIQDMAFKWRKKPCRNSLFQPWGWKLPSALSLKVGRKFTSTIN